jgi:hypothetical protein
MYCILSLQIYIQSNIRQYVVSALLILYTWKNFLQTLLKCSPQLGNVQNPSYPCASLRSRPHLKVKTWLRKCLVHWKSERLFVTYSNIIWQYIFILLPVQFVFFFTRDNFFLCICICATKVIPFTTFPSPLLSRTLVRVWIAFSDSSSFSEESLFFQILNVELKILVLPFNLP